MIDPDNVPDVDDEEMLARFIVAGQSKKSLRKLVRENETVKPQLFVPYSHVEISVNRHRDCTDDEIWQFGKIVATVQQKTLHGRCDIEASSCKIGPLKVKASQIRDHDTVPDNPNHADITGYPTKKDDQISLAQKLAASASLRIEPPLT